MQDPLPGAVLMVLSSAPALLGHCLSPEAPSLTPTQFSLAMGCPLWTAVAFKAQFG